MNHRPRLNAYTRETMIEELKEGTPVAQVAKGFRVSRTTVYRWHRRYLKEGAEGLRDRSSRPHRVIYRLSSEEVARLKELRLGRRWGPARLAPMMGAPMATIYRCLARCGMGRLPRPPKEPVVRYEVNSPGELVHLDVLHLFALKGKKQAYQFTMVDGHTRMAYASISHRRTTEAALEAVAKAGHYFGFPIQRILTDNDTTFAQTTRLIAGKVRSQRISRFTHTLNSRGIRHSLTRIRRPQTNGKVERFHRTIQEELYRPHALFVSEEERARALDEYLAQYNFNRHHTALGGLTPAQRRDSFLNAHLV